MKAAFISWWQARRIAAKLLRIQTHIEMQREHPGKWQAFEAVDQLRREVLYGKY